MWWYLVLRDIYFSSYEFLASFINRESYSSHCLPCVSASFFELLVCASCVFPTLPHIPNSGIRAKFLILSIFGCPHCGVAVRAHFLLCKSTSEYREVYFSTWSAFSAGTLLFYPHFEAVRVVEIVIRVIVCELHSQHSFQIC